MELWAPCVCPFLIDLREVERKVHLESAGGTAEPDLMSRSVFICKTTTSLELELSLPRLHFCCRAAL